MGLKDNLGYPFKINIKVMWVIKKVPRPLTSTVRQRFKKGTLIYEYWISKNRLWESRLYL